MHVGGTDSIPGDHAEPCSDNDPSGVGTRGDAMRPYGHRRSHDYSNSAQRRCVSATSNALLMLC